MFLRRLTSTAFAALMLTGFAAASAQAQTQTQTRHHARSDHQARAQHRAHTGHHARARHHAGRTRHMAHGGAAHDRGPTSSDRGAADQLNAQSLEQARAGAGNGGIGR